MQRVDGVLRKILFILLGLISIYWLYWSVRYMFTDVFPIMSRALFLSVITVLIIIGFMFYTPLKALMIRTSKFLYTYRYWVISILFVIQVIVSLFAQAIANGDATVLYKVATNTPLGGSGVAKYFSVNSNNFLIAVFFKMINRLVTAKYTMLAVSILNAVFIDVGILLLTSLSKQLKDEKLAQIVFLESFFLFGLQPQFLYFYSDPITFFLMSLLCYLVIKNRERSGFIRWFIIGVIFSIAYQVRMPVFVYLIALVVVYIYQLIFSNAIKNFKKTAVKSLFVVMGIVAMSAGVEYYAQHQHFAEYDKKYTRSLLYYVDLGLTDTGSNHYALPQNILYPETAEKFATKADLAPQIKADIKKRLSEYGLSGLIRHQSTKFKLFVQDGSLGWTVERVLQEPNVIPTKLTKSKLGQKIRDIVYVGRPYYANYALYMQFVWIIVVFGLVKYFKKYKHVSDTELVLQLVLFGGILFLSLFEAGRSRYLIQFLPAIILLSSFGYQKKKID